MALRFAEKVLAAIQHVCPLSAMTPLNCRLFSPPSWSANARLIAVGLLAVVLTVITGAVLIFVLNGARAEPNVISGESVGVQSTTSSSSNYTVPVSPTITTTTPLTSTPTKPLSTPSSHAASSSSLSSPLSLTSTVPSGLASTESGQQQEVEDNASTDAGAQQQPQISADDLWNAYLEPAGLDKRLQCAATSSSPPAAMQLALVQLLPSRSDDLRAVMEKDGRVWMLFEFSDDVCVLVQAESRVKRDEVDLDSEFENPVYNLSLIRDYFTQLPYNLTTVHNSKLAQIDQIFEGCSAPDDDPRTIVLLKQCRRLPSGCYLIDKQQ